MRVPNPKTCGVQGRSPVGGYGGWAKPPSIIFFLQIFLDLIYFFKNAQMYLKDAEFSLVGIFPEGNFTRGNFPKGEFSEGGNFPRGEFSVRRFFLEPIYLYVCFNYVYIRIVFG